MRLDVPTLFTVSTCVTALLGAFLVYLWIQDRSVRALAWWGAAYLIGGSAVALWGIQITATFPLPIPLPAELPTALLFLAGGTIWNGARLFHGRRVRPFGWFAGMVVWLVAGQLPGFTEWTTGRIALSSIIIAFYTFLTAVELRRERRRSLARQWASLLLPALHGAVFLSPVLLMAFVADDAVTFANAWFAVFALQTLLYVVGTAFVVVVMAKEELVRMHKTAASTDPLTGLFNRRGFLEAAQRLMARRARRGQPVTVMLFDLDHFKSINDRFGHAVGDAALRVFAAEATANMRSTDIVGRLGGEEFVVILPSPIEEATAVGERVRMAFALAGAKVGEHRLAATVSVGAASSAKSTSDIEALLDRADAALYRAKATGRNRLVAAEEPAPVDADDMPRTPAMRAAA
jgi:diguanylate cyclase (GGDEF)-like protein